MKTQRLIVWTFCVFCFLSVSLLAPASAKTYRNSRIGFTLEIPNGAREFPELMAEEDFLTAYILSNPAKGEPALYFGVQTLGGTIGREKMDDELAKWKAHPEKCPLTSMIPAENILDMKLDQVTWRDFDIEVLCVEYRIEGIHVVSYCAQIPLRREAVQILVCSEKVNQKEGHRLLRWLLANLEGQSNWTEDGGADLLTKSERWEKLFTGLGRLLVVLVVVGLTIQSIRRHNRKRKESRTPPPDLFPPAPPSDSGVPPVQGGHS